MNRYSRNQVRSKRSKFTKFVIILAEQKLCSLERRKRAQFVLCEDDNKLVNLLPFDLTSALISKYDPIII